MMTAKICVVMILTTYFACNLNWTKADSPEMKAAASIAIPKELTGK